MGSPYFSPSNLELDLVLLTIQHPIIRHRDDKGPGIGLPQIALIYPKYKLTSEGPTKDIDQEQNSLILLENRHRFQHQSLIP